MTQFKIKGEHLNNVLDTDTYINNQLYTICKSNDEDNDMFPYAITYNINQYDVITIDTMVKLHKLSIKDIMKEEKDLYELNINGFDCIIYRFRGHLNGYVSLIKEGYYDLDTADLNVHGGITYEGDIHIIGLNKNYSDRKLIGFDTAHAGDAFLEEGFDYTLETGTYKKYDYVYNQLEELTNQIKNKAGLRLTDGQRYLKSFIQEVKDYKELEPIQFYIKYCLSGGEEDDIKKQYTDYLLLEQAGDTDVEDILSYDEWLEDVYYEENQYDIEQSIHEYREPLDVTVYHNKQLDEIQYSIFEIQLTWGGPNIMITVGTRFKEVTYEFIWGGERIKENLSYLYDEVELYFNLNLYDEYLKKY